MNNKFLISKCIVAEFDCLTFTDTFDRKSMFTSGDLMVRVPMLCIAFIQQVWIRQTWVSQRHNIKCKQTIRDFRNDSFVMNTKFFGRECSSMLRVPGNLLHATRMKLISIDALALSEVRCASPMFDAGVFGILFASFSESLIWSAAGARTTSSN